MGSTLEHMERAFNIVCGKGDITLLKNEIENAISHYKIENKLGEYSEDEYQKVYKGFIEEFGDEKQKLSFEEQRHGKFRRSDNDQTWNEEDRT